MFSGNTDHTVNIWDLKNLPEEIGDDVVTYEPTYKFIAHNDAVNAVWYVLFLTSVGKYLCWKVIIKFTTPNDPEFIQHFPPSGIRIKLW